MPMDKLSVLKQYFGHTAFRPGQETLIDAILSGRDALGIMPTGGGKSMCYQVPALLLPGLTLVISPLISLMKDQVAALQAAGVPAAFLNSALSQEEAREVWRGVRQQAYKLLYIAPERLADPRIESLADSPAGLPLVAVDEAHCISQWGQDFRPSYLKIADFVAQLPVRPVLAAFTATATAQVQEDIAARLGLRDPLRTVTGFDRPNLFFDVQRPQRKLEALLGLIAQRRGKCGIVYCATRSGVEKVCAALIDAGVSATRYHAGLSEEERLQNQNDFQYDRRLVMVATNAFGMGIDKSNVSYVIHYNMPKNLESYYQEAGRAGRDGEPADCILLYSGGDITTAKFLIDHGDTSALSEEDAALLRARNLERLEVMAGYCKTAACLRGCLLDYFGQTHPETCGNCGNCAGQFQDADITVPAQMILSCIHRDKNHLGYYVGATLITQILRGAKSQRITDLGLDTLSTYGLMKTTPRDLLRRYLDCLEAKEYIFVEKTHSTLRPTGKAAAVLFHGEPVTMRVKAEPPRAEAPRTEGPGKWRVAAVYGPGSGGPAGQEETALLKALKATRTRLAQAEGVPAYIVFSNAALADMSAKAPRTMDAFLEVSGVGQVKASRYGDAFLETIQRYFDGTL